MKMTEKIYAYYEQLHQATGDLLDRAGAYRNAQELESLQSEHARLRPEGLDLGEAELTSLMGMRTKLLTLMENSLYTA